MSLRHSVSAGALLLALTAAPALAAPIDAASGEAHHSSAQPDVIPSDATEVDEVIVVARLDRDLSPAAAGARERLDRTPGGVAVVGREAYDNRLTVNLSDALKDTPGVFAEKRWGEEVRLSVRGSGVGNGSHNRGLLLSQDGVPFNQADGSGDFQELDLENVRWVEVYRGGNALRFGGASLGGAVNLVSPTGLTTPFDNSLRLEGGSYGTAKAHAELGRRFGDWDLFAGATALEADGYRDHSAQSSVRLGLNLGRSFGDGREARLYLAANDISNEIPGALTLAQWRARPTQATAAAVAKDYHRDMRSLRGSLQLHWALNDAWSFEGGAYAAWKDLDHPISSVLEQDSTNLGALGRLSWEGELSGRKADLVIGAWGRDGTLDGRTYVNLGGNKGAKTADYRQGAQALDLFGEGRLFVTERLAVVAGASWGWAGRDYDDHLVPARSASRDYDWFSPRIGLLWQADDKVQVFANLTRSVEAPTFSALVQAPAPGFVPVESQTAWTAEVGTRGRRGPLSWDVSLYRAELDGEMLGFIPGPDIPAATFNAGKTLHQGLEARLDWTAWEQGEQKLRLVQTWSWSDFRFEGDRRYGDDRLPVVPEHRYRAELHYSMGDWWAAPALDWTPRGPWIDYANTQKAPGYAVWSLGAGWKPRKGLKVFVDARNLTDERWVSNVNAVTDARVASTAVVWPGEGRSVYFGLAAGF